MRRIVATLLISGLLASSAPTLARRGDDPWNPIQLIKKTSPRRAVRRGNGRKPASSALRAAGQALRSSLPQNE